MGLYYFNYSNVNGNTLCVKVVCRYCGRKGNGSTTESGTCICKLFSQAGIWWYLFPNAGSPWCRDLKRSTCRSIPMELISRRKPPQLLFWSCWLFIEFSTTWTSLDFYTVFDSSFREVIHDVHYNLPWITFTLYINGTRLGSFTSMKGFCSLNWNMLFEIGVWTSFCLDYIMFFLLLFLLES